jgi:RNA polymerase sigma-70 factor (ECF subfamily)
VVCRPEGLLTRHRGGLQGAEEAEEFGEFFRVSYPATLRRAYRVSGGRTDLAQDAVQEAYIRAMERWGTLRRLAGKQQRAWLGRTVINILMDAWRSRSRAPVAACLADVDADPRVVVPAPDADQVVMVQWYRQVCAAAATHLTGRCREAFALHFLAGYEVSEVAAMLGITSTTVRVHLSTARRKLMADAPALATIRDALRQEGVT